MAAQLGKFTKKKKKKALNCTHEMGKLHDI